MRRSTIGLFASVGLLALAGCGPDLQAPAEAQAFECPLGEPGCDENVPVGEGGELEIEMGEYYFDVLDGLAVTGEIDIIAINAGSDYHNIEFLGAADGTFMGGTDGEAIAGSSGGETGEGMVALFPGEWTVICNVPGHRAFGMEDTLTVYATPEEAEAADEEDDDLADPGEPAA